MSAATLNRTALPEHLPANSTLATPAAMRAVAQRWPGRRTYALSLITGEQYSADAGDHLAQGDDEPLRDSDGDPMILVAEQVTLLDAASREPLGGGRS